MCRFLNVPQGFTSVVRLGPMQLPIQNTLSGAEYRIWLVCRCCFFFLTSLDHSVCLTPRSSLGSLRFWIGSHKRRFERIQQKSFFFTIHLEMATYRHTFDSGQFGNKKPLLRLKNYLLENTLYFWKKYFSIFSNKFCQFQTAYAPSLLASIFHKRYSASDRSRIQKHYS